MAKSTLVRDPLYDYIEVTSIERELVDKPEFQRLRHVLQNSTAYLTYPGNNNGRFLHSLGVMHLAGEMYVNALSHASEHDLEAFLETGRREIDSLCRTMQFALDDAFGPWTSEFGNAARFSHAPLDTDENRKPLTSEELCVVNILWQAVRLAALVHDLGHLPMSHVFEEALKEHRSSADVGASRIDEDYNKRIERFSEKVRADLDGETAAALGSSKPHEILGMSVFYEWVPQRTEGEPNLPTRQVVFAVAKRIFLTPEGGAPGSLFHCLHSIIASEVDADRLDYCMRDPRSCGLELGALDHHRILNNLVLMAQPDSTFVIVPDARSLSALESYFQQRYLLYRYLIYHHNVVRMDGVVKEILKRLFACIDAEDELLMPVLKESGIWRDDENDQGNQFLPDDRFRTLDDAWLRTLFFRVLTTLENNGADRHAELHLLLETFLLRKSDNIVSMWKREYEYFADYDQANELNELFGSEAAPQWWSRDGREALEALTEKLRENQIILVHRPIVPKAFREFQVRTAPGELSKATETSAHMKSFVESVSKLAPLHLSFVARDIKHNPDTEEACRAQAIAMVKEYGTKVASASGGAD